MTDIFNSQDRIFGDIPFLKASREPCIVCGHPTGDCTGENHNPQDIHIVFAKTKSATLEEAQTVYVDEDIYEVKPITQFTTAKVLVARKGQTISLKKALELGIKIN